MSLNALQMKKHPFVYLIVGRRSSGKTTLFVRLLRSKNALKQQFHKIIFICPSFYDQSIYDYIDNPEGIEVYSEYDPDIINDLIDYQQGCECENRDDVLVVLDDIGDTIFKSEDMLKPLKTISKRGRHLNISLVWLSQRIVDIPTDVRLEFDELITFNILSKTDFNNLQNIVYFDGLKPLMDKLKGEPYSFLRFQNYKGSLRVYHKWREVKLDGCPVVRRPKDCPKAIDLVKIEVKEDYPH